jgi:uncharacterized protein YsxB (DUF464 family)
MLSVVVSVSPEGCLQQLRASGHAGASRGGTNAVCAAVTALIRTAAEVLHSRPGVRCDGEAPAEGELALRVHHIPAESLEWARGVTDSLVAGCLRVQSEAPEAVAVEILRRG